MSKFLDRLKQIKDGEQTALGFGVSRTRTLPGMALVVLVSSDHAKGVKSIADLKPDADSRIGMQKSSVAPG